MAHGDKEHLDDGVATSNSSPLRIAAVEAPAGGVIGMTLCPGKIGPGNHHPWVRNLDADLQALASWGARSLITLMELRELVDYQVQDLGPRSREHFGQAGWFHLPIVDGSVPDQAWELRWEAVRPMIHRQLQDGERIVIHCLGGLGRTGLLACRLLIESGIQPKEALEQVRGARPGAVETLEQERYVLALRP